MSTYFKKFPVIEYTLDDQTRQIVNILTAVLPRRLNVDKTYVFQKYIVSSGERPEATADKLYKDPNLWWTFFTINNLVSPYTDWRMSDEELEDYCTRKYGDNLNTIHHYINNTNGKWVDEVDEAAFRLLPSASLPAHITPVSNLGHETQRNSERGEILVVNPRYISQFVDSYMKALEGRS